MEFHICCHPGEIAPHVLLPATAEQARQIADRLDEARLVSDSRGYMVYTGTVAGIPMTVSSTGIGGPQLAIGVEELAHMGAQTFIRIGLCGTLQDDVPPGTLIVPQGVYRGGATGNRYLATAYPAAANFQVLTALVEAAREQENPVRVGVGLSHDAFYGPEQTLLQQRLRKANVLSVDLESDTLFVIAGLRQWKAGAILVCDGAVGAQRPPGSEDAVRQGIEQASQIAIKAMTQLAGMASSEPRQAVG